MVTAYKPKTLKDALEIYEYNDCIVFAGGTDLMVRRKHWAGTEQSFDKAVLFITEIKELQEIRLEKEYLQIGAGCTFAQLIESSLIPDFYKEVFAGMASPSIRNAATLGGNICNSSPAGDSLPLLYALDAKLVVQSSFRKQELPMEDFILGPGRNILKAGELLTAIRIPTRDFNVARIRKVGARKAQALSKLSFVGLAAYDEGGLRDIRMAFGAAAPTVIRNREIEEEIISMYSTGFLDLNEIKNYYSILLKPIDDQRSTAAYRKAACIRLLEDFIRNIFL